MHDRHGDPVAPEDVLHPEELADYYRVHPERDPRRRTVPGQQSWPSRAVAEREAAAS
jgi:hypothetical protein